MAADEHDPRAEHADGGEHEAGDAIAETPKRGGCLTLFLIVTFVMSPLVAWGQLYARRHAMAGAPALVAPSVGYLLIALAYLATMVCAVGIFRWKRWGVYGYLLAHVAIIVLGIYVGSSGFVIVSGGVVVPAILLWLLRSVAQDFE